jgi:hydroxymethylpyrimidine pyrophosphatase-like HAD family hydrolase
VERGCPDPTGFLGRYLPYARGHYTALARLEDAPLHEVVRVVTHHDPALLEEVLARAGALLGGTVRGFVGLDQTHGVHRLEFLHAAATKWNAVMEIARREGIAAEEIFAAGDDTNDVEMLVEAGDSVAAPGANEAARRAARTVLESGGARAVAAFLVERLALAP